MDKEYINCKLAMTPQCPNYNHKSMLSLFASAANTSKILTEEMINSANAICKECNKFIPKN